MSDKKAFVVMTGYHPDEATLRFVGEDRAKMVAACKSMHDHLLAHDMEAYIYTVPSDALFDCDNKDVEFHRLRCKNGQLIAHE
jgi:hypothetical protein